MNDLAPEAKKDVPMFRYIKFGVRTYLNKKKIQNGIILLKYRNLGTLSGKFKKQVPISSDLKNLILDIIHTGRINIDTQKSLTPNDSKLFDELMKACRLVEHLNYEKYQPTVDDHVKRFKLLRGGLEAGNHSKELRTELIELLQLLSHPAINKISLGDAAYFTEMLEE